MVLSRISRMSGVSAVTRSYASWMAPWAGAHSVPCIPLPMMTIDLPSAASRCASSSVSPCARASRFEISLWRSNAPMFASDVITA